MAGEFAGTLRDHIRIERIVNARDALGAASDQVELVGEFWVAGEAIGSGAESQGESRSAMPRWRFTLRRTNLILVGDQVIWKGRTMVIQSVSADLRFIPKTIILAEEKR